MIAAVAHADGEWVLYGGMGLARTHLPSFRLSEDLDLLAHPRRVAVAELEGVVARRLHREFGAVQWQPPLSVAPENTPVVLRTDEGLAVRVQVGELDADRRRWPVEVWDVMLGYSDGEPARVTVPTLPAFVALKTAACGIMMQPDDATVRSCARRSTSTIPSCARRESSPPARGGRSATSSTTRCASS